MNRNWVYSLFALWIVCSFACTQPKPVANVEVQKENFVFSIKGTDTLSLDKYELPSISPASKKPVMIFAFGGGFKGGDKADKGYIPYFEFLARNGFVVVSTDYRTTLKNLDPSKVSSPMDFIAALQHAIDTAVEDFYDATGFVINQRFQLCRCDLICRCGLWCASSTLGKDALSDYAIPWRCG